MIRPILPVKTRPGRLDVLIIAALVLQLFALGSLSAQSRVVFAEAQLVGSWESGSNDLRPYSMHPDEVMQKPSLGFDLLQRFGSESRDWGYLAIQARLAYDENKEYRLEGQLYNAYFKLKTRPLDAWIGHNKPALGLSSTLDNHSQLLMDNTMSGLVMDRDWGIGLSLDRGTPELELSLTTGSGMTLYYDDSWLLAARAGLGRFVRDNHSLGASLAYGNVFKTMGYNIMHNKVPHKIALGGVDYSHRIMGWELRSEILYGRFHEEQAYSSLLRLTWYPLTEDRAELTLQGQAQEIKGSASQNYAFGAGYRITPDLALRTTYHLQQPANSHSVALQIYYYKALPF